MIGSRTICRRISAPLAIATILSGWIAVGPLLAVERVYTLVPSESRIAISGTVLTSSGSAPIQEQGPGSLSTTYSGTIRTDRDANSIQFIPGSLIDANVNGNWQPLANGAEGAAPADYGSRINLLLGLISSNFAVRDVGADLMSGELTIGSAGSFGLDTTKLDLVIGNIAYRANVLGMTRLGSASIAGQTGFLNGMGSLSSGPAGAETLTIPIDVSYMIGIDQETTVNFALDGQLVANATPAPSLAGDFNQNGAVDAADYVVWRNGLGSMFTQSDYDVWRANFGRTAGATIATSAELPTGAVPEPALLPATAVALVGLLLTAGHRR
jgi:hypothetical protein